jgi:hypothetical protein
LLRIGLAPNEKKMHNETNMINNKNNIVPLQEAITETATAKNIVIFTGAGMSADSGIGTFRGQGGAWSGIFGTLALIYGGTSFTVFVACL